MSAIDNSWLVVEWHKHMLLIGVPFENATFNQQHEMQITFRCCLFIFILSPHSVVDSVSFHLISCRSLHRISPRLISLPSFSVRFISSHLMSASQKLILFHLLSLHTTSSPLISFVSVIDWVTHSSFHSWAPLHLHMAVGQKPPWWIPAEVWSIPTQNLSSNHGIAPIN